MNRPLLPAMMILPVLTSCASQQVSYRNEIVPILEQRCIKCHVAPDGPGNIATGLEMDSYHSLMQGTYYGPVDDGLDEQQVRSLREWVNQGALNH